MKSLFIKQALKSKNPFWMYLLGSFIIIIFNLIGQLPLSFVLMKEATAALASDPMEILSDLDKNIQTLSPFNPLCGRISRSLVSCGQASRTLPSEYHYGKTQSRLVSGSIYFFAVVSHYFGTPRA